ncbi:hypothetical protein K431DRAFT_219063 [Polychaeton citri CBS 116435]|uniref:Uncharacterized protein n=1 Tax=Polychaeton citri CBS 116435 TaxID=1314669 RepID=A0A9P4USL3_9PEZI|nr:hypothetical protein K431DRAFT_219063 [Polychaeton citri CBS 116435]
MGSVGYQTSSSQDAVATPIVDIRSDTAGIELKDEIYKGLRPTHGGEKSLPTLLLYDDEGLRLFEEITYLDEYYLTGAEIDVLEQHATQIAARIPDGAIVVELGSGNLRKVKILLDALEAAHKRVEYYALDLMRAELQRTLDVVPKGSFEYVSCSGLWGTYDDGLVWLQKPEIADKPKVVLSLGSSVGNFSRTAAAGFLKQFADILSPKDALLIGIDSCQDAEKVFHAYNDRAGVTHAFTLNGLRHANKLLAYQAFDPAVWETFGRYNANAGRHEVFILPNKDVIIDGVSIAKGEALRIEESYKFDRNQIRDLWKHAGVVEEASWFNSSGDYGLHMISRPDIMPATKPEQYAAHPVPSVGEWHDLWKVWDTVTRQMIPEDELFDKPIKLRNACVFYLGHIPTFLDMKLTEGTGTKATEPLYYQKIFERGIDPDVDNPEHCHAHSEIPDTWPPVSEMIEFQQRVRERVLSLYETGAARDDNWTGRVLWLGFEHEVMHLETLLYMLLQSDKTLPPTGTIKPNFQQLAVAASNNAVGNEWFDVPAQQFTVGLDDDDSPEGPVRYFGWDVEKPSRTTDVPAFRAKGRPITVGEFAKYMIATGTDKMPASWTVFQPEGDVNGGNVSENDLAHFVTGKAHRTVYGPVPLKYALEWPVSASYDELAGCAEYMGGRIPTKEETLSIYYYVERAKRKGGEKLSRTIPAVNGHLVNEGVEESPTSNPSSNGTSATAGPNPSDFYVDLENANVGFKHWHPTSVSHNGGKLAGQGEMGGVWEWTSSALEKPEDFVPMKLYPAYSADFFDEKHNVILGGSWATLPRIAGRKTFVNWYQRNYLYVWAGARLVQDN